MKYIADESLRPFGRRLLLFESSYSKTKTASVLLTRFAAPTIAQTKKVQERIQLATTNSSRALHHTNRPCNNFIDVQKAYLAKGKILSQAITKKMLTPQLNVYDGGYKEQMAFGSFLIQTTDNKDPREYSLNVKE